MINSESINDRNESRTPADNEKRSGLFTGIFFIIVGGVALARSFMIPMPEWLFTWQILLIMIGIFVGLRRQFEGAAWFILIIIGGAFLFNDFYFNGDLRRHIWPLVLIVIGAAFILRPRNRKFRRNFKQRLWIDENKNTTGNTSDFADITIVFGSSKKKIAAKKFAGGDITAIFGGAELDLTHTDIEGEVVLDITAIFGGVELIIPSNWAIKSEVVSILASVKDKRVHSTLLTEEVEKTIILDGTALFGGIEIKSFKK
jgi:predicted membrane protein